MPRAVRKGPPPPTPDRSTTTGHLVGIGRRLVAAAFPPPQVAECLHRPRRGQRMWSAARSIGGPVDPVCADWSAKWIDDRPATWGPGCVGVPVIPFAIRSFPLNSAPVARLDPQTCIGGRRGVTYACKDERAATRLLSRSPPAASGATLGW